MYLQYLVVLLASHLYCIYLLYLRPFQTKVFNNYVFIHEMLYSALIVVVFIFTDAAAELYVKITAAVVVILSVNLMFAQNIAMALIMVWKGSRELKKDINRAKLRRRYKELVYEEEMIDVVKLEKNDDDEMVKKQI